MVLLAERHGMQAKGAATPAKPPAVLALVYRGSGHPERNLLL